MDYDLKFHKRKTGGIIYTPSGFEMFEDKDRLVGKIEGKRLIIMKREDAVKI